MAEEDSYLSHIICFLEEFAKDIANPDFPSCETNSGKSKVLTDRVDKCDSILETLQRERDAVDQVLTRVRMELISLRGDSEENRMQLADLTNQLNAIIQDLRQLREARQNVGKITQEEFAYLKNLKRPPQVLVDMLIGVGTLFGIKQEWADVQRFQLQMDTKDKIMQYDPLKCDKENIQHTIKWIDSHSQSFDHGRVMRASKTFAPLAVWLDCTVGISIKYQDMKDLPKRKELLSEEVKELEGVVRKGEILVTEFECIEKQVQKISVKQTELKETLKTQRKEFAVRRSLLPEDEDEKEELSLQHRDTLRMEYPTQVFVDWKSMMTDSKKKKRVKKNWERSSSKRLSQIDRSILTEAWKRESISLAVPAEHKRNLTGIDDDDAEQIWREGEGWVKIESVDKNIKENSEVKNEEKEEDQVTQSEDTLSAEAIKGLFMSIKSEKLVKEKPEVKSLSGFLELVSDRLDEIQD